jgi:hypothetical protein
MPDKETRPESDQVPALISLDKQNGATPETERVPARSPLDDALMGKTTDLTGTDVPDHQEGVSQDDQNGDHTEERKPILPATEIESVKPVRMGERLRSLFGRGRQNEAAASFEKVDQSSSDDLNTDTVDMGIISQDGSQPPDEMIATDPHGEVGADPVPASDHVRSEKPGLFGFSRKKRSRNEPEPEAPEEALPSSVLSEAPSDPIPGEQISPIAERKGPSWLRGRQDLISPETGTQKSASSKGNASKGRKDRSLGYPPIQVLIGWIEESARKDVIEHARGFASDHIETLETAWIAMAEFRGGTLFEIHEGGGGYAYLPDLIEGLSRDPDQVLWVPSGMKMNRVVTLSIVEGRPFSMMLNEADSAHIRASGQLPVERSGRMRRLQPRGTPMLVVGATLFALGFTGLSASAYMSAQIEQQPIPSLPYSSENLPHRQIISLSNALREDRWVSRIQFENGVWRAEFETFDDLVLPIDTGEAQQLIDEAVERELILQQERERKIREIQAR